MSRNQSSFEGGSLDTLVLGAGISGLSAAHETLRGDPSADLLIVDREPSAGGVIETESVDGLQVEWGPNSLLGSAGGSFE